MDLDSLKSSKIIPEVYQSEFIPKSSEYKLTVSYGGKAIAPGDKLTPFDVQNAPTITFIPKESKYYSIIMVDADAPSRTDRKYAEICHWAVLNIPLSGKQADGEEVVAYIGAGPPESGGFHRYIFFLYETDKIVNYTGKRLGVLNMFPRMKWKVETFAMENNLGNPVDCSYFEAQYDEWSKGHMKEFMWSYIKSFFWPW